MVFRTLIHLLVAMFLMAPFWSLRIQVCAAGVGSVQTWHRLGHRGGQKKRELSSEDLVEAGSGATRTPEFQQALGREQTCCDS